MRAARPVSEGEAVATLVKFLFDYEQLRRPVGSMSGGERTRLRCLLLMLSRANCLVLDEPTNHLDIPAVETLESALEGYDGTVIAVSHDRYFLDRIADRIVEVRRRRRARLRRRLQRVGAGPGRRLDERGHSRPLTARRSRRRWVPRSHVLRVSCSPPPA